MFQKASDLWPRGEKPAQAYCGEDQRLAVLAAHGMDALVDDPELADIVALAAELCDTPMAMVSVVESRRQVFLARMGLDVGETPRSTSFCAHAMLGAEVMTVPDATLDPRFERNPLVTGEPGIRFYAGQPLVSAEGAPIGALCVIDTVPRPGGLSDLQRRVLATLGQSVMRRLVSQRQDEEHSREQEERFRQVLDSFPGIAWSADAQLNFDYFNARWKELTDRDGPTTVAEWAQSLHPEDFARSAPAFEATTGRGEPFQDEVRLRLANGEWCWMMSRVAPIMTSEGERRWVGTLIDIDREHRQREANDLLAAELSHRIKNIFAVISGLIAIRSRGRVEVADFATELGSAVRSLGTAHDYVRPLEGRTSESLEGLLQDLMAPYHNGSGRISIVGDAVKIGARAATPLALIFHELATNSAKYGALSSDTGQVRIEIAQSNEEPRRIAVTWVETGVEPKGGEAEAQEGFGSRLLRMAIEGQLQGRFERCFAGDGMRIEISFPATSITG